MASRLILAICALSSIATVSAKQDFLFISNFKRLTLERLDPIVTPGLVSGHVHHVFGGNSFSPSMSQAQAISSSCTTGDIEADKSIYWTPAVYWQAKNGSFIAAKHEYSRVYYEGRPVNDNEKIYAFPPGFRMVAGNPFRRSEATTNEAKAVTWACAGSNLKESQNIPAAQCSQRMRPQIGFPMCWDGMRTDSANHVDHVAYPTGGAQDFGPCPCTHPYKLPHLHVENYYFNEGIDELDQLYREGKQPLVLSNGDTTGYGFHGDFINGWDQAKLEAAVNTCQYRGFDESTQNQCPLLASPAGSGGYTPDSCTLAPQVIETVEGTALPSLPGCNPLTSGPADAVPVAGCTVKSPTTGSYGSTAKSGDVYLPLDQRPPKMPLTGTCPAFDNTGNAPASGGGSSGSMGSPPLAVSSSSAMAMAVPTTMSTSSTTITSTMSSTMSTLAAASAPEKSLPAAARFEAPTTSSTTSPSMAPVSMPSSPPSTPGTTRPSSSSSPSTSNTPPTLPSGWSSLGCYIDTLTPRSLPFWNYYHTDVDSSSCAARCQELAYKYAGTENSGQCFCGNDPPASKATDQSECNLPCKRQGSSEICGGAARLSVFGVEAAAAAGSGPVHAAIAMGPPGPKAKTCRSKKHKHHAAGHVKRSARQCRHLS